MGYYRWRSETRPWGSGTVQADLIPFDPDWFRIDRWSCAPIPVPIPLLEFRYPRRARLVDLVYSPSTWEPYSPRLRSLLREVGAQFEEFPCRLLDKKTGETITDEYAVVHLMGCRSCFDWERSDFDTLNDRDGKPFPTHIRRLVLTQDCLRGECSIFRLEEARHLVLANERLRSLVLERKISGVRFDKLEDQYGY